MARGQAVDGSDTAGSTSGASPRQWRSALAVALLVVEIFLLRKQFTTDHLMGLGTWWTQLLVQTRFVLPFSLCLAAGMSLASGSSFLRHYLGVGAEASPLRKRFPWVLWATLHAACFGACLATGAYLFQARASEASWLGLSAIGFVLALASLVVSLVGLVVPLAGFARLVWQHRLRLPIGAVGGFIAYGLGIRLLGDMPLWRPMGAGTMWLAYHVLGLFYPERVLEPDYLLLGTPEFDVIITRYCSGYEGAALFLGFFTLFIYLSRERLRFPRVLWLLPLGIALVYLVNALRIALLVILGTEFSRELAMEGFHVNAGWPFFGITAWIAVLVGTRSPYFSRHVRRPRVKDRPPTINVYAVYMAPLVVAIACVMLSDSATRIGWVGDLVKLLGVGFVAILYRHEYWELMRAPSRWGLVLAVVGAATWSLLFDAEPSTRLDADSQLLRIIGFVLITPFAEELFFRGFLMRRLAGSDFEAVPVRTIGPWPLIFSSLLFGGLHHQWLAGTACGLIFALAYRLRGRLGDALLAHMLTNAILVAFAYSTGDWGPVG